MFALCENEIEREVACSRIVIRSTDDALVHKLVEFKLHEAHCFDPNDEAKIRAAIATGEGGSAAFEKVIRDLGQQLKRHQQRDQTQL